MSWGPSPPRLVAFLFPPLPHFPPWLGYSLQLASSAVAWNECGVAWCCRDEWKFSSNASTEASLRAYEDCQITSPKPPLYRPGPSPEPTPEPMHMLCYNSGPASFPPCPDAAAPNFTSSPPPPPPPNYGPVDVCSSVVCLQQSGWPSLHYGRVCMFSARFAYPLSCALWASTFGAREVAERKAAFGGPGWNGSSGTRFALTDEAAAAAVAAADRTRAAVVEQSQDPDAGTLAVMEALAPIDVWVKHGIVKAKGSSSAGHAGRRLSTPS